MNQCPRCLGKGDMGPSLAFVMRSGRDDCDMEARASSPCSMCDGTGQITDEHARRYDIARRFRDLRVRTRTSLAAFERIGFRPADISRAERLGIGGASLFSAMELFIRRGEVTA